MTDLLYKIHNYILSRHYLVQVVLFYFFSYLVLLPFLPILYLLTKVEQDTNAEPHNAGFLLIVGVGPMLETLVFQYLVYRLLQQIPAMANKPLLYVIVSAISFGLSHYYNMHYILFATVVGVILGYIFYFYRHNLSKAFGTTALVHILHNLTTFVLFYFKIVS